MPRRGHGGCWSGRSHERSKVSAASVEVNAVSDAKRPGNELPALPRRADNEHRVPPPRLVETHLFIEYGFGGPKPQASAHEQLRDDKPS